MQPNRSCSAAAPMNSFGARVRRRLLDRQPQLLCSPPLSTRSIAPPRRPSRSSGSVGKRVETGGAQPLQHVRRALRRRLRRTRSMSVHENAADRARRPPPRARLRSPRSRRRAIRACRSTRTSRAASGTASVNGSSSGQSATRRYVDLRRRAAAPQVSASMPSGRMSGVAASCREVVRGQAARPRADPLQQLVEAMRIERPSSPPLSPRRASPAPARRGRLGPSRRRSPVRTASTKSASSRRSGSSLVDVELAAVNDRARAAHCRHQAEHLDLLRRVVDRHVRVVSGRTAPCARARG